ncbi:MAG TPA: hypothetical protein VER38_03400 [Candidatus Eisenbacteria bacterium]|nr:hypothetical protein [Candidatus Eisenbacteria bacterium]
MKSLTVMGALTLALAALVFVPSSAGAFALSGIGGRMGGVDPDGAAGAVTVGGHLEFEESGSRVHLQPGVMFWSTNGLSDVNPNFDLMYHFAPAGRVGPYVGAGAGMHFYSFDVPGPSNSNTDLGANLFGGVLIPSSSLRLFVEGRLVATDRSQAMITGGVTLPFHH